MLVLGLAFGYSAEMGMGPFMGRVGLGRVGSHFPAHVMGWVGLD